MSSRFIRNEIGHVVVSCRFVDASTKFTQTPSRVLWNFRILLPCPTLCLFFKRCNAIPSVLGIPERPPAFGSAPQPAANTRTRQPSRCRLDTISVGRL
ncbi:unnamed protein product [Nesidiocoris tenuis]|uniref:Uncharacterized protein n=1 Tax=Nesidiocoris tenuis TaxID=355587 RepID=A0A6H5GQJ5_9HEMI|nr:unnamed protein product [Nesidiocoris tenuis]